GITAAAGRTAAALVYPPGVQVHIGSDNSGTCIGCSGTVLPAEPAAEAVPAPGWIVRPVGTERGAAGHSFAGIEGAITVKVYGAGWGGICLRRSRYACFCPGAFAVDRPHLKGVRH